MMGCVWGMCGILCLLAGFFVDFRILVLAIGFFILMYMARPTPVYHRRSSPRNGRRRR